MLVCFLVGFTCVTQHSAMAGLFPFRTRISPGQPQTEGYMQVQVQPGCPLLPEGGQLKGYFYSCCEVLEERVVGGFSASLAQAGAQGPPVGVEAAGAGQGKGVGNGHATAAASGAASATRACPMRRNSGIA